MLRRSFRSDDKDELVRFLDSSLTSLKEANSRMEELNEEMKTSHTSELSKRYKTFQDRGEKLILEIDEAFLKLESIQETDGDLKNLKRFEKSLSEQQERFRSNLDETAIIFVRSDSYSSERLRKMGTINSVAESELEKKLLDEREKDLKSIQQTSETIDKLAHRVKNLAIDDDQKLKDITFKQEKHFINIEEHLMKDLLAAKAASPGSRCLCWLLAVGLFVLVAALVIIFFAQK